MCYVRAALRYYADSLDQASWGKDGITLLPGDGVAPDSTKNAPKGHLKGDIQVGVWRILGAPDWPPANDTIKANTTSIPTVLSTNMNTTATNTIKQANISSTATPSTTHSNTHIEQR